MSEGRPVYISNRELRYLTEAVASSARHGARDEHGLLTLVDLDYAKLNFRADRKSELRDKLLELLSLATGRPFVLDRNDRR